MDPREAIKQSNEEVQRQREALYTRVFGTNDGRAVLRDLVTAFDFNQSSFQEDFNPHKAALRDGHKEVIRTILSLSSKPQETSHEV